MRRETAYWYPPPSQQEKNRTKHGKKTLQLLQLECISVFPYFYISVFLSHFLSLQLFLFHLTSSSGLGSRVQLPLGIEQQLQRRKLLALLKSVPVIIKSRQFDLVNFVSLHILWHSRCFLPNTCCVWVINGLLSRSVVMINSPPPTPVSIRSVDISAVHNLHTYVLCICKLYINMCKNVGM